MTSLEKQTNSLFSQESVRNHDLVMTHTHEQLSVCREGQWQTAKDLHKLLVTFAAMPAFELGYNVIKDKNISLWLSCTRDVCEADFEEGISEAVKFFDATGKKIVFQLSPMDETQYPSDMLSMVEKVVAKINNGPEVA